MMKGVELHDTAKAPEVPPLMNEGPEEPFSGTVRRALWRIATRPDENCWRANVMVVDDDEADTSVIKHLLIHNPRVMTVVATTVPENALGQLTRNEYCPDLILLDIRMPRMNGFRFIEALRKIPKVANVPVVLLTTSCLEGDMQQARDANVSGYMVKQDTYERFRMGIDGVIDRLVNGDWN